MTRAQRKVRDVLRVALEECLYAHSFAGWTDVTDYTDMYTLDKDGNARAKTATELEQGYGTYGDNVTSDNTDNSDLDGSITGFAPFTYAFESYCTVCGEKFTVDVKYTIFSALEETYDSADEMKTAIEGCYTLYVNGIGYDEETGYTDEVYGYVPADDWFTPDFVYGSFVWSYSDSYIGTYTSGSGEAGESVTYTCPDCEKEVTVQLSDPLMHSYEYSGTSVSDDGTTATATFTCQVCAAQVSVEIDLSALVEGVAYGDDYVIELVAGKSFEATCTTPGVTTYSVVFTFAAKDLSDKETIGFEFSVIANATGHTFDETTFSDGTIPAIYSDEREWDSAITTECGCEHTTTTAGEKCSEGCCTYDGSSWNCGYDDDNKVCGCTDCVDLLIGGYVYDAAAPEGERLYYYEIMDEDAAYNYKDTSGEEIAWAAEPLVQGGTGDYYVDSTATAEYTVYSLVSAADSTPETTYDRVYVDLEASGLRVTGIYTGSDALSCAVDKDGNELFTAVSGRFYCLAGHTDEQGNAAGTQIARYSDSNDGTNYLFARYDHTYDDTKVPTADEADAAADLDATCTSSGYTKGWCTVCGEWVYRDVIPATGHEWVAMLTSDDDSVVTTSGDTEMYLLCANGCGTIITKTGSSITVECTCDDCSTPCACDDGCECANGSCSCKYTVEEGLYNYGVDAEVGPACWSPAENAADTLSRLTDTRYTRSSTRIRAARRPCTT